MEHKQSLKILSWILTPLKTNMTLENQPFEYVSPTKMVIFHCHASFRGIKNPLKWIKHEETMGP